MKRPGPVNRRERIGPLARGLVIAGTAFALVQPLQGANSTQAKLDARIAELKAKSAELVASERARLAALSPQQRLSAPPAIWRVPDAIGTFRDCVRCPEMVVIPAGEFTMGSPDAEAFRGAETQHRVTIAAPFAIGKFEITFDQWGACVKDGGCNAYRPDDQHWGRGKHPAIDISWENAKAYVSWLSRKTGKPYRLLSEAEWEYAARAGTTTAYATGSTISPRQANYDGSGDGSGPSAANRQRTLPVGSFPANGFGLYDMQGNVSQWVEDCWHDDYTAAAPTDGSAWLTGDCNGRVLRGGSWGDSEIELRAAARTGEYKDNSSFNDGLRIARSL
jgi:formylglycine-generating enzyme required for sulfatase activity